MLLHSSSGSCSFQALEAAEVATRLFGRRELIRLTDIGVNVLTKSVLALGVVMGMCTVTHGTCNM